MPEIKPGSRFASSVCTTEIIIVKGFGDCDLCCGGAGMEAPGAPRDERTPSPQAAEGTQMGKRYVDAAETIEVLCVKPGDGSLGIGNVLLKLKDAKPLPASD
ncbi:MAG: hypothetical protein P8M16_08020 [Acidimicrobiales bacterium]|nr:hypothetical protein [Acidimicrobiales bacterium]